MAMDGTWPGMRTIGTATRMPDGGPMAALWRLFPGFGLKSSRYAKLIANVFPRFRCRYRLPEGDQDFIDSQSPGNSKTEGDSGVSD